VFGAMAGRKEFSDGPRQLISLSDGPNLHRNWNGIRAYLHAPRFRVGAFELRATRFGSGSFDDGVLENTILRGANASIVVSPEGRTDSFLDPFWFHTEIPGIGPNTTNTVDRRDTYGLRLWGHQGTLRWDWTAVGQSGRTIANRRIDALALFAVQSLSLSETGWKPRLTSHLDIASGDHRTGDHRSRTFHPLYASSNYLGEGQFLGLSNLVLFAPGVSLTPGRNARVSFEYAHARRLREDDAVYAGGFRAYAGTQGTPGRHIGNLSRLSITWQPSHRLSFDLNAEHLEAGRVLQDAGFDDGTQIQFTTTYRY